MTWSHAIFIDQNAVVVGYLDCSQRAIAGHSGRSAFLSIPAIPLPPNIRRSDAVSRLPKLPFVQNDHSHYSTGLNGTRERPVKANGQLALFWNIGPSCAQLINPDAYRLDLLLRYGSDRMPAGRTAMLIHCDGVGGRGPPAPHLGLERLDEEATGVTEPARLEDNHSWQWRLDCPHAATAPNT